jgi:hypothetical protein
VASVVALREQLRVRLDTIDGLRTYAVMPAKPEPPAASVALRSAQFDRDLDGNSLFTFDVWVYVNPADLTRAQSALDAYLGTTGSQSVKAAIEADQSLGGTADYVRVTGWTQGPSLEAIYGGQILAIAMQCEVMA